MINRVSVYCASSTQIRSLYLDSARNLGSILASCDITTVYGGGSVGSMGALADGVIANNGTLIGVIPEFMMDLEWGNPLVSEMIVVATMAERKLKFIENVDAVIALPGGSGTLEELSEAISLKKLGLFVKPIIILNIGGFFDPLIRLLENMVQEKFLRQEHLKIYSVINSPEEVINAIETAPKWDSSAIKIAAI